MTSGLGPLPAAHAATTTFDTVGEHPHVVPAGQRVVHVVAEGGNGAFGGAAARVEADLPVVAGSTLYAVVGSPGVPFDADGVFNGGGGAALGLTGGGASDLRRCTARAAVPRMPCLVAGRQLRPL